MSYSIFGFPWLDVAIIGLIVFLLLVTFDKDNNDTE